MTEAHSQWQNRAESEIRELKRMLKRFTRTSGSPQRLWCYLLDFICKIRRLMVPWDAPNARPPSELRLGTTPDISEAAQFDWYQYVWFVNPKMEKCIARYIGVADNIGAMMTFWLLPKSCLPVARSSVSPVTDTELQKDGVKKLITELDSAI